MKNEEHLRNQVIIVSNGDHFQKNNHKNTDSFEERAKDIEMHADLNKS